MNRSFTVYTFCILSLFACESGDSDKYRRNVFLTHSIDEKHDKVDFYYQHIPEQAEASLNLAKKIKGVSDTCYLMLSYYSSSQILNYLKQQESYFPPKIKSTLHFAIEDMIQFDQKLNAERIQILENEILSQIIDHIFKTDLRLFDNFAVIPRMKKQVLQYGEPYEADILLAVSSSVYSPTIIIDEEDWKDTLIFDNSVLPFIKVGKDKYHRGVNKLTPKYLFKTEYGVTSTEFKVEFEVE